MSDDQNKPDRTAAIAKAWRNWLLMFVPILALVLASVYWLGFDTTYPLLIGLLVVTLLYQKFVNKRSWRSILWGVYALDK